MGFDSITVVGLGLIGGSFAGAAGRLTPAPRVVGTTSGNADVIRLHETVSRQDLR
jgi:prephenate dehydrogenase